WKRASTTSTTRSDEPPPAWCESRMLGASTGRGLRRRRQRRLFRRVRVRALRHPAIELFDVVAHTTGRPADAAVLRAASRATPLGQTALGQTEVRSCVSG